MAITDAANVANANQNRESGTVGSMFEKKENEKDESRVPWAANGSGVLEVVVKGSNVRILKDAEEVCSASAPYHVYAQMAQAIPAFDTHTDPLAATCLAEMLPQCGMVALVVQDTAGRHWNEELTRVLKSLGAIHVPPVYRASWAFLWTPEQKFEAYNLDGIAEVKTNILGRRFELQSAGWKFGNFAKITIDGVEQLLPPKIKELSRGINCCLWGPSQTRIMHMRQFEQEYLLTNYLSQLQPGTPYVVVCAQGTLKPFQRHPPRLYDELMRLGGSGLTIGFVDSFILSGTVPASPTKKRKKPSAAEITSALERAFPRERNGNACISILFGQKPALCLGALVLAKSLQRHSPNIPRILLVTRDVPRNIQHILQQNGWRLQVVPYLNGAYTNFHAKAKFPAEIFMKLHMFDPNVLPYQKVLFLDLDTFVRKDITPLFQQRTPAAVNNWKGAVKNMCVNEGEVMDPEKTSFNAGVFLCSPNAALFQLLKEDAEQPGVHHKMAWAPEQDYLAIVLAGHLRNLHCKYNFEPQIHGGTCVSHDWQSCEIDHVHIVHFSGAWKPWDMNSHDEISCVGVNGFDSCRQKYRNLETRYFRQLATERARAFHEEWFRTFEEIEFLQDTSLDGDEDGLLSGVVPEKRMAAFLERMLEKSGHEP